MSRFMKRIKGSSSKPDDLRDTNPWEQEPPTQSQSVQTICHPDESTEEVVATPLVAIESNGTMWSISQAAANSLRLTLEDAPTLTLESMLNSYNRAPPKDRFLADEGFRGLMNFAVSFKAIQALDSEGAVKVMPSRLAEALNAQDHAIKGPPPK